MEKISSLSLRCEKSGKVSTGCGSTREDEVKTGFPGGREAWDDSGPATWRIKGGSYRPR